ncbi:MAG: hypothetical protein RJA44_521 [Pseudomonadota bacterium]
MVLADGIFLSATALGLTLVVAWGVRRYYRARLVVLVHDLEAARAASAHHALWAEEQRIELSTQVRELQQRIERAESQPAGEARRTARSPWTPAAASSRLNAYAQANTATKTRIVTTGMSGISSGHTIPTTAVQIPAAATVSPEPIDDEELATPTTRKKRAEPPDFADTEPLPRR